MGNVEERLNMAGIKLPEVPMPLGAMCEVEITVEICDWQIF